MKTYSLIILLTIFYLACPAQGKHLVVAQNGTADFKLVQQAFDHIPRNNKKPVTIYIKNGVYIEKLFLDSTKENVTIIGENKFKTILRFDDHAGKRSPSGELINTYTSQALMVYADNFSAKNICFQNNAGFNAGQAVAVHVYGDKAVFSECRFLGFQDVLFTNNKNSRQYYERCYIEGTTDFIFGEATAWFQRCHIHSKKNSHVTANATPAGNPFGYVFNECILTADSSLRNVSLGRPWQPYSSVAYINCYLDRHIIPEGWNNWKKPESEKTARYAEYNSYGPGADTSKRLPWTSQLTDEQMSVYTINKVFRGWDPIDSPV